MLCAWCCIAVWKSSANFTSLQASEWCWLKRALLRRCCAGCCQIVHAVWCWLESVVHIWCCPDFLVLLNSCCSGETWHFQVMDSLVVSLSKFTSPLNPLAFKPVVTFGENEKARIATEAVFTVANRYARAFHKHYASCFYGSKMVYKSLLHSLNPK